MPMNPFQSVQGQSVGSSGLLQGVKKNGLVQGGKRPKKTLGDMAKPAPPQPPQGPVQQLAQTNQAPAASATTPPLASQQSLPSATAQPQTPQVSYDQAGARITGAPSNMQAQLAKLLQAQGY